ncbi:ABC transporter ATP-binding protein [Oscillospiraceae bacterium HV4-5-C5C]|nr:ABC transporter ATP-binding protein [Oscillospiraceae bacterium HV4-5-C5C]
MNKTGKLGSMVRQTLRQQRRLSWAAGLIILASVLTALLPPLALERIVDRLTAGQALTLALPLLYFCLLAAVDLLEAWQNTLITVLGQKVTHALRTALCAKLSRLEAKYFTQNGPAEITSRFVNDVDTVDDLFSDGIVSMMADSLKVLSILLVIFYKSLGLGLLVSLVTPGLFALTRLFQKRLLRAQLDNRIAISQVNQHLPETLHNLRTIRNLNSQGFMQLKYDHSIQASYQASDRSNFYDSVYSPMIVCSSTAVTSLMMCAAASGSDMQQLFGLSVGSAVAVMAYVSRLFTPLESIGMEIQSIQSAVAGVRRINEFLAEAERPGCPASAGRTQQAAPSAATRGLAPAAPAPVSRFQLPPPVVICFDQVSFSYDGQTAVLKDFSLTVRQGESVTFSGRSGAGKSTLFRLILGFWEPQQGQVLIMGQKASQIPDQARRALFGYVEQSFHAVPGTIADQISLFDQDLKPEQLRWASRLAGLDGSINKLPRGYQTPFSPALFSQGQLQLLAIARAIAAQPQILLFDEMTANMDSETERQVLMALDRASRGRTVLSISHRQQQHADRRILLRQCP